MRLKYSLSGLALVLLAVFAALGLKSAAAESAASAWAESDFSSVRLISATETTGGRRDLRAGLQFKLKPGWKVYWRSPGDAGFPPTIDWSQSTNLKTAALSWPIPERFSVLGFETLGYKKEVVLPIAVTAAADGPVELKAKVKYLACAEICIPLDAALSLNLPDGATTPSAHAHLINRYAAVVPGDGKAQGLSIESLSWREDGERPLLRVTARGLQPFTNPDAFVEGAPGLSYAKPMARLDGKQAVLDIAVIGVDDLDDAAGKTLGGRAFTVTVVDGRRAVERKLTAVAGAAVAPATAPGRSLTTILLFALLGGLILNLMPCVLPVLSLKLMSLVKLGGRDARHVRFGFIASAAGIVAAFLAIAGALIALKASGGAIGWGIQFQQPAFLIAMTLLIAVFACNMWGFFEFRLPGVVADFGGSAGSGNHLGGHFLQGAFATLLATPCSAPFLGTAVGFALAGATSDILAVFTALGVGLALPYLAVALFPGVAGWLPAPGPWMIKLKVVLGLALAATGVWLLSVLTVSAGLNAAVLVAAVAVIICAALYVAHKPGGRGLKMSVPAIAVAALAAFAAPALISTAPAEPVARDHRWQAFDAAAIPRLVAEGRVVFVDVTADWCITCIANKKLVLDRGEASRRLAGSGVVTMQADWTLPDEGIAAYLASFGRYGIPFNVVYGPNAPAGIVLPELLTTGAVMAALDGAGPPAIATAKN